MATDMRERTGLNEGSLSRSLDTLRNQKRLVRVERPLAAKRTSLSRYEVSDPYLRFWLRHLRRGMEMVMRGRGDVLAQHIAADWPGYRGRAVESLARDGVERLLPDERFGQATHVGAYWTRTHDVEVDLVGGPDPDPELVGGETRPDLVARRRLAAWRRARRWPRGEAPPPPPRSRQPSCSPSTMS